MNSEANTPFTLQELTEQLSAVGLISREELTSATVGCEAATDGHAIVDKLADAGRLTAFQAQAIHEGRMSDLVIGNYEILARLGAGGMGTVFKARHRRMKRIVALKVMSRQLCNNQNSVQRFQREVETIARLSHPNIVLAYDADEAEVGHFLVMELVDGRDLASVVQQSGPLSIRDAVSCTIQTAQGLAYAHSQSIMHRDIKPANLLRDHLGMVKITDLGLARLNQAAQADADTGLTQTGSVVGTPDYMSPEQAMDSGGIDHRTDIYSLGCTLYYLLLGSPPYQGNSIMATLLKHRDMPIPMLSALRPDTPAELEAVFRKMVAKKPADRFQTMEDVVAALMTVPLPMQEVTPRPSASVPPTSPTPGVASKATLVDSPGNPVDMTVMLSPKRAASSDTEPSPAENTPVRALLVESSRAQAAIIRKYLENLNIETDQAANMDEAIAKCKSHKPDVVLSAMFLKDGSGSQLGQRLNVAFPFNAPGFVLITSQEESKNVGSLSDCGKAVALHKPFNAEQLAEAISRVIHRSLRPLGKAFDSKWIGSTSSTADLRRVPADRSQLRLLIVDDSAAARANEKRVLGSLGFTLIAEVMDGAQAVAAVAQHKYDLIITDYNMPLMDGAALIGYLRQNPATASIPIILVTTETNETRLKTILDCGVAAILPKAFSIDDVRPVIGKLFGS